MLLLISLQVNFHMEPSESDVTFVRPLNKSHVGNIAYTIWL